MEEMDVFPSIVQRMAYPAVPRSRLREWQLHIWQLLMYFLVFLVVRQFKMPSKLLMFNISLILTPIIAVHSWNRLVSSDKFDTGRLTALETYQWHLHFDC